MTQTFRPGERVRLAVEGVVTYAKPSVVGADAVQIKLDGHNYDHLYVLSAVQIEPLDTVQPPKPLTVEHAQVGDRLFDDSDWATVLQVFDEPGGVQLLVRDDRVGLLLRRPAVFSQIRRPVNQHAEAIEQAGWGDVLNRVRLEPDELTPAAEPMDAVPPTDARLERETRTVALTWAVNARSASDEPSSVTMHRAGAFLAFLRGAQ